MKTFAQKQLLIEAKKAASKAARLLLNADQKKTLVSKKGRIDLVTDVDLEVNKLLCSELALIDVGIDIDIIAEEGVSLDLRKSGAELAWIIDPIDGTTNFVHGLKHSAISIALYDQRVQSSLVAVVLNPFRDECFSAIRGQGAFLNDKPIRTSNVAKLESALICTGFAYDVATNMDNNLAEFCEVLKLAQGLRRFGSASLDLAYVAVGRFDGYFEQGLRFWDYAAGMLLVTESGGKISAYDTSAVRRDSGHIIAANAFIYPSLIFAIQTARSNAKLPILPRQGGAP